MFEYFPGNYIWNLGVVATLNSGGADRRGRPGLPADRASSRPRASDVGHAGVPAPRGRRVADQVEEQAVEAEKAGHLRTAGQKYFRAAAYLCQAERMLSNSSTRPHPDLPPACSR